MQANPVLVELTRGPLVESRHRGAVAVVNAKGNVLLALGDVATPVFPRSAIKPMQALPLIETGAADQLGLEDVHVALACGSHLGTPDHVRWASEVLAKAGLGEAALACGAHRPIDQRTADGLVRDNRRARPLHNNCSGKHAGMLATAVHMSEPIDGYLDPGHPVQQRIRRALEDLTGAPVGPQTCGVDGCGVPNWAIPLAGLATAFAKLVCEEAFVGSRRVATERLRRACWAHPIAVGGEQSLDTKMLQKHPGEVLIKTGAEGVYCAGIRSLGLGVALKIDDGAKRAAETAVVAVLARFVAGADQVLPDRALTNWRGRTVGEKRLSDDFSAALDRLNR